MGSFRAEAAAVGHACSNFPSAEFREFAAVIFEEKPFVDDAEVHRLLGCVELVSKELATGLRKEGSGDARGVLNELKGGLLSR